jgi:hypothetical protein
MHTEQSVIEITPYNSRAGKMLFRTNAKILREMILAIAWELQAHQLPIPRRHFHRASANEDRRALMNGSDRALIVFPGY